MLADEGSQVVEEEVGGEGWVGTRIEDNGTPLKGSEEVGREMGGTDIGHPEGLGEEFGEHHG